MWNAVYKEGKIIFLEYSWLENLNALLENHFTYLWMLPPHLHIFQCPEWLAKCLHRNAKQILNNVKPKSEAG